MNIQDEIDKQLKDNVTFARKIESLMTKVDIMNDNERDMLLVGFSRNAMSHFLSINLLIERKWYNSAFALIRVFFENILKLKYMYHFMDNKKIKTIYIANSWDKHFPSVGKMAEAIDEEFDVTFYTDIKQNAYKIMNDYTHTGPNQIARHFSELEPSVNSNFSNELILKTLEDNKALLKTAMIDFLAGVGLKNEYITKDEIDEYLEY